MENPFAIATVPVFVSSLGVTVDKKESSQFYLGNTLDVLKGCNDMSYRISRNKEGHQLDVYYMHGSKGSFNFCSFSVYFYVNKEGTKLIVDFLNVHGDSFVIGHLRNALLSVFNGKEYSFTPEKTKQYLPLPDDDGFFENHSFDIDEHLSRVIGMIKTNNYQCLVNSLEELFSLNEKNMKFVSKSVLEETFLEIMKCPLLQPRNNIFHSESFKMHIYYLLMNCIKNLCEISEFMPEIMTTHVEENEKFQEILREFQEMKISKNVSDIVSLMITH
jgi:hypothetical protein